MYEIETERFKSILGRMLRLHEQKNRDYGNAFGQLYADYGAVYAVMHLDEKLRRLRTILLEGGGSAAVKGEEATDSLLDLACYSVMTLVQIEGAKEAAAKAKAKEIKAAPSAEETDDGKE